MNKKIILFLISILAFNISAQESADKPDKIKNLKIYFIRNSGNFIPFEEDIYAKTFLIYRPSDTKKSINYYEFGFRKQILETNFYIDTSFYELKKGNYGMDRIICGTASICYDYVSPIGSYYRSQVKTTILYEFLPKLVKFTAGLRYLKTELADGIRNSYNLRFSQLYFGPDVGLELTTPKIFNSTFTFNYTFFYLTGRITNKYEESRRADPGYIQYLSEPLAQYYGQEFGIKYTYSIDENLYLSLGYQTHRAKVRPSSMTIRTNDDVSNDAIYDFIYNSRYSLLGGKSFSDNYNNLSLEIGIII